MKKLLYYAALFFIPIWIITIVFHHLDITPFGENSIWYIDLPQQITMFYNHFYDIFKGNGSTLFTWNYGMGTSFWATIAYYLSSPLSILILLFPRSLIPFSILLIWLVKIGLSSLTMAYLLKKYFTRDRWVIFIFSISYSLMSYSLTYYFLPMWVDAVYLLPLIIAGVHALLKTGRSSLFLFSLTVMFFANFYISYMVGIFVFFYFVAELYLQQLGKKEIMTKIVLFFKSVILAFLFTSFMTIPTFLELRKNKYTGEEVELFSYLLNPLDLYGTFFNGTTVIQNLSIYSGIAVILFVPLYFLNKKFSVKERVVYGLFLAFLLYSMMFTFLNMAWHVFELPNGAHYRYAFVVSFLLILLAVKAVTKLEFSTIRQIIAVAAGNLIFLSLANKVLDGNIYHLSLIHVNLLFVIVFAILTYLIINKNISLKVRIFAKTFFCLLILWDLGLNSKTIFSNYISESQPHDWYEVNNPFYEKAFERLQNLDDSFYRTKADSSLLSTLNESLRYKYKGMGLYTSTGSYEHNMFLGSLGYDATQRAVAMQNGIFLSDALFGFKYVVTTGELDEKMYTKMFAEGPINVYKINLHLPLGYIVDEGFMRWSGEGDMFSVQNHLLNGKNAHYYEKQDPEMVLHSLEKVMDEEGHTTLQKVAGETIPSIETTIPISDRKELYIIVDSRIIQSLEEKIDIFINGKKVEGQSILGNLIRIGAYEDEHVDILLQFNHDIETIKVPDFYTLNLTKLKKTIDNIETFKINEYDDTYVTGEITVENEAGILFLSIPYDENWKVRVDGKEASYQKIGNFIGVPLNEGKHVVHLEYVPKILYLTISLSVFSLGLYFIFIVKRYFLKRKASTSVTQK